MARILLTEFSSKLGSETLNVRVYREAGSFICEREVVERDGTSFTMVLPVREAQAVRKFLAADPHYAEVRPAAVRALQNFERAVRTSHGK
jgi:hypothetical protein